MILQQIWPIHEMFDSRFTSMSDWVEDGDTMTLRGSLLDEELEVKIELRMYEGLVWANIAFARKMDNGTYTQELVGTGKHQSSIFGAVRSVVIDKLKELESRVKISALVAMVVSGEERRVGFYDRLLSSTLSRIQGWGTSTVEIKVASGTALVAFAKHLDADSIKKITTSLRTQQDRKTS